MARTLPEMVQDIEALTRQLQRLGLTQEEISGLRSDIRIHSPTDLEPIVARLTTAAQKLTALEAEATRTAPAGAASTFPKQRADYLAAETLKRELGAMGAFSPDEIEHLGDGKGLPEAIKQYQILKDKLQAIGITAQNRTAALEAMGRSATFNDVSTNGHLDPEKLARAPSEVVSRLAAAAKAVAEAQLTTAQAAAAIKTVRDAMIRHKIIKAGATDAEFTKAISENALTRLVTEATTDDNYTDIRTAAESLGTLFNTTSAAAKATYANALEKAQAERAAADALEAQAKAATSNMDISEIRQRLGLGSEAAMRQALQKDGLGLLTKLSSVTEVKDVKTGLMRPITQAESTGLGQWAGVWLNNVKVAQEIHFNDVATPLVDSLLGGGMASVYDVKGSARQFGRLRSAALTDGEGLGETIKTAAATGATRRGLPFGADVT